MKNGNMLKNTNNYNKYSIYCLIVLIVVFIEIFVFNFRFFQGLSYKPVQLDEAVLDSSIKVQENYVLKCESNDAKIRFENIDTEVKNIYINIENAQKFPDKPDDYEKKDLEANKLIKVKITIDDDSNSKGIQMPERGIVSTVERTKYIPLSLKGESHTLTLELKNAENKEIKINGITLNKGVPFHFSIVRVLLILLLIILIYVIRPNSVFYDYRLNFKKRKQKVILSAIVILQIGLMCLGSFINPVYVYNTVSWQSQYNELADALLDGHFYLNDTPDQRLGELENPYDPSSRDEAGINVSWDHAYYEGKYYVYFGIVPALLFNIPAKLIADTDIKPFVCILILIPVFVIMSFLLIYALARRFMDREGEDVPLLLYILLTILFINGTGTAFLMVWPDMYTLPIFTGLTFGVSGLYFWITSFKPQKDDYKLNNVKLLLGSLCLSLIAGCRPQMLLVMFTAIPLFWKAVFKDRKLFSKNGVSSTVCFLLPIVIFAGFMFYYNYARFGSVFDFGANYNLTTNDMTSRGFRLARIPQGIFSYFLQPLSLEGVFPYITTTAFATQYMGTTIKEGTYGGILFLQPILWMLLITPKVRKELKEKGLYIITVLFIIFAVVIAGADSIMAGILPRYFMDFSWLLLIADILVIFAAYNKYKHRDYGKLFNKYLPICFLISMLINLGITIGGKYYTPAETNPEVFYKIAAMIQFWL
ncbi:MAG: hypothetical protein Q4D26_02580 [Clostridia bacterium]|nr:hypothetical protein [Clostridia bacterium]